MAGKESPGELGVACNRRALQALLFACERLMGVAASVLVRIGSSQAKVALSTEIWILAQAYQLIADRTAGLRTADVTPRAASRGYADFTNQIVSLQNPLTELVALIHIGYPDLRDAITRHRARLPVIADEATIDCLSSVLTKVDMLRTGERPAPHCLSPIEALIESCGGALGHESPEDFTGLQDAPDSITLLSAMPVIPIRPGRDMNLQEARTEDSIVDAGYGSVMHDFAFRIELCATEVCASILAHHPEAPWGLRFDLAKQTRDEARHFELFIERVHELGLRSGAFPIKFEVWDKFRLGRSLPERLIIEQRLGEGSALDSVAKVLTRLKADGEHHLALVFEYITADEVSHVANGNKWLRRLLGDEEAVYAVEDEVRQRLAANGLPLDYKHSINVEDRRLSGFTEAELYRIQQMQIEEDQ